MSTPVFSQQTATVPDLPDHSFRLVKVIETRKDANNQDVHHLTVFMETLIDGRPSRQKVTSMVLSTNQDDLPTLSWHGYVEQDL